MNRYTQHLEQALAEIQVWQEKNHAIQGYEQLVRSIEIAKECHSDEQLEEQLQVIVHYLADRGLPPKEFSLSLFYVVSSYLANYSPEHDVKVEAYAKGTDAVPPYLIPNLALLLIRLVGFVMLVLGVQGLVYSLLVFIANLGVTTDVAQGYGANFFGSFFWSGTGIILLWKSRQFSAFIWSAKVRIE